MCWSCSTSDSWSGRFRRGTARLSMPYLTRRPLSFIWQMQVPYPIHLSATGCRTLGSSGLPSGLFESAQYEQGTFQLAPGDSVLFATDGLSEARDGQGRQLDMSHLVRLCGMLDYSTADTLLQNVFEAVEQFARGSQCDDMTAVAMKIWPRNSGVAV